MNDTDGRHSRSVLFPGIGAEGQRKVAGFSLAIVGVGAVGAAAAEMAARAGVGRLTLVDRDVVEESNLSRQFLFDAEDAARVATKAGAAEARLREIAPDVEARGVIADLDSGNAREILAGHDLVLDGSDNFETRLLVSDASRALGLPSIYAACVGEVGLVAVALPDRTPCLRCYLEALPPAGSSPTCDTVGIVPTLPRSWLPSRSRKRCASRWAASRPGASFRSRYGTATFDRTVRSRPFDRLPPARSVPESVFRRSKETAPRKSSSSAAAAPFRSRRRAGNGPTSMPWKNASLVSRRCAGHRSS